jgi:conjugative transposon TraK protein
MFQKMKNIDSAFKLIRSFSLLFLVGCAFVCFIVTYKAFQMVSVSQHRIYILANGKALEAFAADRKDNIPVEARDHIKMFHHHFFTLDPDEKVIQSNIVKALYLADASAKREYDNLKEAGYYANLISGNISQTIEADTIHVDTHRYPYYFRYVGKQTLVRPSAVVTRSLITEGYLRNVSRSDNNAHGFLIEKWRTLENIDLTIQSR